MTSETMTAEDVAALNGSSLTLGFWCDAEMVGSILATYAENARLREENERLTVRLDETTKVAAYLLCEDEKLHARLAEVEQDSKRLVSAMQNVMTHTARAFDYTHDIALANGLLDSIARIADAALSRPSGENNG